MGKVLVLGRDMNAAGTDIGEEVKPLLRRAVAHQQATGDTIVVAPGFSPDFPDQPESYAWMMANWLLDNGAVEVEVLHAATFNTYGEMLVFFIMCEEDAVAIIGYDWHLKRAKFTARRHINKQWAESLEWIGVEAPMSRFDKFIEPFKWANASLPPKTQQRAVAFYKRFISQRTSY